MTRSARTTLTGMREWRDFTGLPPEHARLRWCAWFRRHTIDPDDVAVPGFVGRDSDTYRITYLAYDRDEAGRVRLRPDDPDLPATVVRVCQLEACPSEFPTDAALTGSDP